MRLRSRIDTFSLLRPRKAFYRKGRRGRKGREGLTTDERGSGIGDRDIGTSENQNTPRMAADERGLQGEEIRGEVEFVPVPGGYGFHRVRLRNEPGMPGERRPTQAAIAPEERAEVHANLG